MIKFLDLLEAAKKKGVTDKNFGKAPAPSKSNFKVGQRVAIDRGMGRTEHGNVHALDIKSGGNQGAMVHFQDGRKEYHPYSKLKDASQYWADADAKMRKERMKENTDTTVFEAVKLGSKVLIHAPGQSYHGKTGYVGEIRHGAYKGAPKTYTIDYDHDDNNYPKSIQLDKKNIKQVKEEVEIAEAIKPLPRRHFFDSYGLPKHGIAYTNNSNFWKIEDGKPTAHTSDHEVLRGWKRELAAKTKVSEETEIFEGKDETVKVGDHVHVGHSQKGGSGYRGIVTKIDGEKVHFRSHDKDVFGHKQYVGQLKNTSIIKEDVEITEGKDGTIIHKVIHQGKVKFITRYGKAAQAVADKIKANTGVDAHITQHIADSHGFYRLHKEEVEVEEAYGDKKYGLGKKTPEEIGQLKAIQAKHNERTAELKQHMVDAEHAGDWDAHEKHEKALKLHQAMYPYK